MCASRRLASLNYMDIKQILDRKAAENKRGTLTMGEIKLLVQEIHNSRKESKLEPEMREREMAAMQKKIKIQRRSAGGSTTVTKRRDHENLSMPNGRLRKLGNERDKDRSNRTAHKEIRC
jgi:hypothetical protein